MKLLSSNPKTVCESIGYAIDLAIIENTKKRGSISERKLAKLLNSFTLCSKIVIEYDSVSYEFLFRNEKETLTSLYQILGWVTGEGDPSQEMWVETFLENGFSCHDKDGYETRMTFYND